ncbi:MAG: PorP/SprF family type IX secretion system membrane protein [Bacteroidetes bacterium]|nr:PorP/SprF family type IX secretion system membrane protein [Bacteroidota bacterium]
MNRYLRILFLTMPLSLLTLFVVAQDPTFSQFDPNQIYYNPAYSGYKKQTRFAVTYRNLWPNVPGKRFPGPLSTYSITGDSYFSIRNKFNAGAGAFVMQDVEGQGFLTTTSVGVIYAQHLPNIRARKDEMDRFNIYLGFKAYYNHIRVDWSHFVFSDQLSPDYGITGPSSFTQDGISSRNYFDLDAGLLIRNNFQAKGIWYNELGFAMSHILAPSISITGANNDGARLPRKYIATYRSSIAIKEKQFFIGPSVLFENQGKFYAMNVGIDFSLKLKKNQEIMPIGVGIYNRFSVITVNTETNKQKVNTSAIIVSLTHRGTFAQGENPVGYFAGFSVDLPYMGLGMQTAGAYELTLGISIPNRKADIMKCAFETY